MRRAPEEGQPSQGQPRFDADLSNHMRSLTDRAQSTMTSDDLRASKQSSKLGGNDDGGSSSGARLTPHQAASTLQSSSAATTSAIPAWHLGTGGSSYSSRGRSGGVAKRHDPDAEPMLPSEFMASMAWTSSNHTSCDNSASGSAGGGMTRVGMGGGGGRGSASNKMQRGLMLSLASGEGPYESWPEYKPSSLAAGPASAAASAATTMSKHTDFSRPEHPSLAKSPPQRGRDAGEAPIAQQQQEWDRAAASAAREGRALLWLDGDGSSRGATGDNPYVAVEEDMGGADGGAGIGLGAIFSTFNNNNGAAAFELGGRGGRERAEAVGSEEQEEADEVTATLVPMYVHHGGSSMGGGGGDGGGAGPLNSLSVLLMRSEGVAGLLGLGSHTPASGTNTLESLNNNSSVHNSDLFGSLMGRTGSQSSIAAAAPGPLDSLTALLLRSERERSTEAGVTGLPRPVALAGGSRGGGGGSGSGSGVMGGSSSRGGTANGNLFGRQSSNHSGKDGGGSSRPPRVAAVTASASTAVRPPPPPPMRGADASGNSGASNHSSIIGKARSAASLQGGGNEGGSSAAAAGANPRPTLSRGRSTASARPSRRAGTSTSVAKGEAQRPVAATAAATSSASGLMEGLSSFFTNILFKGLGDGGGGGGLSAGQEDPSESPGRTPEGGPCFAAPPIHNAGGASDGATAVGRGGDDGSAGGGGGPMVPARQQPKPSLPGSQKPEMAWPGSRGSPPEAYDSSGGRGGNEGGGQVGGGAGGGGHGSVRGGGGSGSRLVMLDAEGRLVPVHSGGSSSGFPPHPRASGGGSSGISPHLIAPEVPQWGSAPVMADSLPGGFGGGSGNIPAHGASQWGTGAQALAGFQPGGFDGGIGGGGGRLLVRDAEGRLVPVALGDPSMQPSSAMLGPPTPPYFGPAAAYCAAPPPGAHQVAAPSWSGVHVALVVAVVFVVALNMAVVMYMLLLRCVKGGHHIA